MKYVLCIVLLCSTSFYAAECGKGEKRKDQTQETTESATSKRFKPTLASPTLIAAPQGAGLPPTSFAYIILQKQFLEIMGKVLNKIEQYDQKIIALERERAADSADIHCKLAAQVDINGICHTNLILLKNIVNGQTESIVNLQTQIKVLDQQHKDLAQQTANQLADHRNKLEEHQKILDSHTLAHRIHDDRMTAFDRSIDERKATGSQEHIAHALKGDDKVLSMPEESSLPELSS